MQDLIAGILKFQKDVFPQQRELFARLARSQSPKVLFITCSDSRVVPELLTQSDPGSLFVIRNAGNIVPSYGAEPGGVSATVEYAVAVLGVEDIVICGHSDCGAMKAITERLNLAGMPAVEGWLRHADSAKAVVMSGQHESTQCCLESMVLENVRAQLTNLRTHPSVAVGLATKRLSLHGWMFDIETGKVLAMSGEHQKFTELDFS